MTRFWELDFLRGIAIIMMVIFHLLWDLNYFNFLEISLYTGFWGYFQKATAGLFLFLVGVVLTISYNRRKENSVQKFLKRGLLVFGAGLILTIFTLIAFPEQFIYFGILHLIGVSIILSIPLINRKYLNLVVGLIIISLGTFVNLFSLKVPYMVWLGLDMPTQTLDFFPVIPWFGVVLLGLFAGNMLYENGARKIEIQKEEPKNLGFIGFLGKNSLLIYFIHQPILFTMIYIISILG